MHENIASRLGRKEYVTLSVLRYARNGRVSFAGAHQDILVLRAKTGRVERIKTPGPWIGIRKQIRPIAVENSFDLRDGDLLVLFTDGVIEAENSDGEPFDVPRLASVVEEARHGTPAEIRDRVVSEVSAWTAHQEDDVTVLIARYSAHGK
jgi:serine phosphatase RsbU (regulator of sigma subunit)